MKLFKLSITIFFICFLTKTHAQENNLCVGQGTISNVSYMLFDPSHLNKSEEGFNNEDEQKILWMMKGNNKNETGIQSSLLNVEPNFTVKKNKKWNFLSIHYMLNNNDCVISIPYLPNQLKEMNNNKTLNNNSYLVYINGDPYTIYETEAWKYDPFLNALKKFGFINNGYKNNVFF
jgi:hypothetical protein